MTASATKINLEAALRQATVTTFEELAFLFAAPEEADAPPPAVVIAAETQTRASVSFSGAGRGQLVIVVEDELLPVLAANMLGEDETSISALEQNDALGELTNIICGNVLPQVGGARAVFNLAAPCVEKYLENAGGAQPLPFASTNILFDEGKAKAMLFLNEELLPGG